MSPQKTKKDKAPTRVITKQVVPNLNPTAAASLVFKSDTKVGKYLRIIQGSPSGNTEYILHHPIGVTALRGDQWVLSDPSEVAHLVSRIDDPDAEKRKQDLEELQLHACLKLPDVFADADGLLEYTAFTKIGTYSDFRATVKEAKKSAGSKWNRANWLNQSTDERAKIELRLDAIKAKTQVEFERKYPNTYQTRGGPRRDQDQVALEWADGLSLEQLQNELFRAYSEGPPPLFTETETPSISNEGWASSGKPGDTISGIIPDFRDLSAKEKKTIKNCLKSINQLLHTNGISDEVKLVIPTAVSGSSPV
jgi:hypothetical protein